MTSEATNRSVDCLVSADHSVPRSVISTLVDLSAPMAVISLFVLFWSVMTVKNKMGFLYFLRRSILSAVAVFYISYISVTKTLVNILNCIEVHDSTDVMSDAVSDYWAVDTSLRCYEGSHATLTGAVGWPLLVMFSMGFPITMASIIVYNVQEDFKAGWIYDVAGFMYRSYSKRFVFWEAMIMLRKALLAVVVVFAYPLGANLQGIMALGVLIVALVLHLVAVPFKYPILNILESFSLIVSIFTFYSGIVFNDSNTSYPAKVLLSCLLILINVSLFVMFVVRVLMDVDKFITAKLIIFGEDVLPHGFIGRCIRLMFVLLEKAKEQVQITIQSQASRFTKSRSQKSKSPSTLSGIQEADVEMSTADESHLGDISHMQK